MKSPSYYNYCKSKKQYYSENHALLGGRYLGMNNAYRCTKCRYWHLTSDPKFEAKKEMYELFEVAY